MLEGFAKQLLTCGTKRNHKQTVIVQHCLVTDCKQSTWIMRKACSTVLQVFTVARVQWQ